jgi:hypothetical protein
MGQAGLKKAGKRIGAVSRSLESGTPPFQEVFRKGVTGQVVSDRHSIFIHHSVLRDVSPDEKCNIHSKLRRLSVTINELPDDTNY